MAKGSNTRAALLAVAMNIVPAAPVDIFRFLHVPAVVMTIRRFRGRACRDRHERRTPATPHARRPSWRSE